MYASSIHHRVRSGASAITARSSAEGAWRPVGLFGFTTTTRSYSPVLTVAASRVGSPSFTATDPEPVNLSADHSLGDVRVLAVTRVDQQYAALGSQPVRERPEDQVGRSGADGQGPDGKAPGPSDLREEAVSGGRR